MSPLILSLPGTGVLCPLGTVVIYEKTNYDSLVYEEQSAHRHPFSGFGKLKQVDRLPFFMGGPSHKKFPNLYYTGFINKKETQTPLPTKEEREGDG